VRHLILAIVIFVLYGCTVTSPPEKTGLNLNPTMSPPVMALYGEGDAALKTGDLQKAKEKYEAALKQAEGLGDEPGIAFNLSALGSVYYSLKDYPQARELLSKALPYFTKTPNLPPPGLTLGLLGEVNLQIGNDASAIEAFDQALAIVRKFLDKASDPDKQIILSVQASWLDFKAQAHDKLGQSTQAVQSYRDAATAFEMIGKKDTAASALWFAGDILRQKLKAPNEAIKEFSRALALAEEAGNSTWATWARLGLAKSYSDAGRLDDAESIFSDILKTAEKTDSPIFLSEGHFGLGFISEARGHFEEAIAQYEASLRFARNEGVDATKWEASISARLGDIYLNLTRYEEAIEHLQEAQIKYLQVGDTESEAGVAAALGKAFFGIWDGRTTIQEYKRALELYKQTGNVPKQVEVLSALGITGLLTGQIPGSDADQYFNEALQLVSSFSGIYPAAPVGGSSEEVEALLQQWQKNLRSVDPSLRKAAGDLYQRLGSIWVLAGRLDDAVTGYQLAYSYHQDLPPSREKLWDLAKDYHGLGEAYRRKGNLSLALQYFHAAEETVQPLRSSEIRWIYTALARTEADLGNIDTALQYYRSAFQMHENVRGLQTTEEPRIGVLGRALYEYRGFVALLLDLYIKNAENRYLEEAFQVSEQLRARAFLDDLAKSRATKLGGDLAWLTQKQSDTERQIAEIDHQLLASTLDPKNEALLLDKREALRKEWRDSQQKAAQENSNYSQIAVPAPVTLSEVQKILDTNTVFLEYSVAPDGLVLWAITKDKSTAYKLPGQDVGDLVEKYVKTLRQPLMTPAEISAHVATGTELYQKLLQPAEKLIVGKTRLIIAPDGPLYYLPFETLIVSNSTRASGKLRNLSEVPYLIKNFQIIYVPSASILVEQQKTLGKERNTAPFPLLAFGDPIYQTKTPGSPADAKTQADMVANITVRGLNLNRLEFSGDEVKNIARIWGVPLNSEHINLGNRASVARLRELDLAKYRILHFATHAVAGDDLSFLTQPALILSQLGSQDGTSGILQFVDILQLKLNAELVVLSACDTGLGRFREGEGIVGLTRAFLYAGAASTVSSLWEVEDQSTGLLMEEFYRRLRKGESKAEALRQAKLELIQSKVELKALGMRESLAAPFYWAPFILVGDWGSMRQK
jgi:CHAT domain-containing protein/Tfp pilus assembly protein PilF